MAKKKKIKLLPAEPPEQHPTSGEFRGTSIYQGGQVKMASQEAKLITCPECGRSTAYLKKRGHSRFCSRK